MQYTKQSEYVKSSACVILLDDKKQVFLIKRNTEPFKGFWMMPGGHIKVGETLEECIKREMIEETSMRIEIDKLFNVHSDPDQDPRHHALVVFYVGHVVEGEFSSSIEASDGQWFDLNNTPKEMAFHHRKILDKFINENNL